MKDSLYEENFKLHSENARFRKNWSNWSPPLALTDSGLILKLRSKDSYAGKKNSKRKLTVITASGRMLSLNYALKATLSSSGSSWKTCRNSVTPYFRQSSTRDIGTTDDNTINLFLSSSMFQNLTSIF